MLSEWLKANAAVGLIGSPLYYGRLRRQYAEPQRHYHTWRHIEACLKALRRFFPKQPLADVKLALFFHDAVYDPSRNDNEEKSAEQWLEYAGSRRLDRFTVSSVERMILHTKTHKLHPWHAARNEKILLDLDMSIFIAPSNAYMEYATNVWREYQPLGEAAYLKGRLEFLRGLNPEKLFYTSELKVCAQQAATNIQSEIVALETSPKEILK